MTPRLDVEGEPRRPHVSHQPVDNVRAHWVRILGIDPAVSADLARGKLRKKLPELQRALEGRFRPHHAFLIEQIPPKIDFLDEALQRLTTELDRRLVPFEPMLTALDTIPGGSDWGDQHRG